MQTALRDIPDIRWFSFVDDREIRTIDLYFPFLVASSGLSIQIRAGFFYGKIQLLLFLKKMGEVL